jgi:5-formyltetrahydrofolate cyclo-ligase
MSGEDHGLEGRTHDAARRHGLEHRRDLTAQQRAAASARIVERLLDLHELRSGGRLALYLALPEEVDLGSATAPLRVRGWHLHLPRVLPAGAGAARAPTTRKPAGLAFVEWQPAAQLAANRFGVAEVDGPEVPLAEMDAVIVPCVAVDRQGNRVGFGAGYYDRALAAAPEVPRIGVAFEVQVLDAIDARPWDEPMDVVVTEDAVWRRSRLEP